MPRIEYRRFSTVECPDAKRVWNQTPCLCDCHYGWPECGDHDKAANPPRRRIVTRVRRERDL